jgi:hypothetical protein
MHLVLNYRPSQPHGWQPDPDQTVGRTIGGHTVAKDFTYDGRSYRIGLQAVKYRAVPAADDLAFRQTLNAGFGSAYRFRYTGGFRGRNEFDVQSSSVQVREPTEGSPLLLGADLYVVYKPDIRAGDPDVRRVLRWIQVAEASGGLAGPGSQSPYVDNGGSANPFFQFGGYVSIYGSQIFNVNCGVVWPALPMPGRELELPGRFRAEIFLAQDTGMRDGSGRDVVNIFGGISFGWQVVEVRP